MGPRHATNEIFNASGRLAQRKHLTLSRSLTVFVSMYDSYSPASSSVRRTSSCSQSFWREGRATTQSVR